MKLFSNKSDSNDHLIDKEFAKQETELFSKLSTKERDYMQVERLTMLQMQKNSFEDN